MSEKVTEGQKQWDTFLDRWPESRLRDLTLEEYYGPEAGDSFFSWMTTHTNQIGRFNEGPMSAGVRPRGLNANSQPGPDMQVDERYIWYSILGNSAQEAFANLKAELLAAIAAVRSGDLSSMNLLKNAPGSLVWKVAFLYQDKNQPLVLPFYRARQLKAVAPGKFKGNEVQLQQQLMALRGNKGLLEFAEELELQAAQRGIRIQEDNEGSAGVPPLNQILYGPPGTGKTFATINTALEILDPDFLEENRDKRTLLKKRFDELVAAGQVCFVTFHQSFSYEDFVQGIRAETVAGHLQYSVHDGIFKQLCDRARLGVAVGNDVFEQALVRFRQAIAEADENGLLLKTITGKTFRVEHSGGSSVLAFPTSAVDQKHDYFVLLKDVRRLYEGADKKSITNNPSYVWGVLDFLYKQCGLPPYQAGTSKEGAEKFVLIIDEINRGNVSRIFGELITLIEPSKREGADEELAVSLPYGSEGESFSVPDNVYLIGTMNTADRSLAGLDIALRRRFTFREMPPRPDELKGVMVEGISLEALLHVMNQRIEVLLDRDHCLGHAYFMDMKIDASKRTLAQLALIFRQKILPLLQEYFFEDWERIGWVLNDQHAASNGCQPFIRQPASEQGLVALFGSKVAEGLSDRRWELNHSAFDSIDSYRNILGDVG